MIDFDTENNFRLDSEEQSEEWLKEVIAQEDYELGELAYVFCSDIYLHELNKNFLDHDTLTDIITFDYVKDNIISGEIYISTERVRENALEFGVSFENELRRVMVHGVLHLCGYDDHTNDDKQAMRDLEDYYLKVFEELN